MIVERMDQLSPRERVPMLFLVDAIVQVRRRRSSPAHFVRLSIP
eukprot:COSAG02_NODE_47200_length_343_cov_0.553279_1_plen_43_part_10